MGRARWLKLNRRLSAKKAAALADAGGPTAATCFSWFRRLAAAEYAPASAAEHRSSGTIAARALEFLILTATRTSEAIRAVPEEFDLDEAIWTVRAERLKGKKAHPAPLPNRARNRQIRKRQAL